MLDDPGEVNDLAHEKPDLFQKMLSEYQTYEKAVGVIEMPEGYYAEREVAKKSMVAMFKPFLPIVFVVVAGIIGFIVWRKRRT